MFLYGISRFIIEMYRGDPRGFLFNNALSTSQFISLLLVPLSLIMLIILSRRAPSPDAAERRNVVRVAA
jgi:phosphatidylglycerol:prolipoprotein diacylglycerol transferase